jgi:hypothetical protein
MEFITQITSDPFISGLILIVVGAGLLWSSIKFPSVRNIAITILTLGFNKVVAKKKAEKEKSDNSSGKGWE